MKKRNLKKLAKKLEEIDNNSFDFTRVRSYCGTVGCAMGHCVGLFEGVKAKFKLSAVDIVTEKSEGYVDVACELFDISIVDAKALFNPYDSTYMRDDVMKRHKELGLRKLGAKTTPKRVAENIRRYVNGS